MPYSNKKRHNPPSIPQTPYQPLIIPCPNFDPIYQVILLENPNEWNLFPAKRWILEKRREQGLKSKRGETSYEELHVTKKRDDEIYKLMGEIISKEKERRSHFPVVQHLMCGLMHTHTSFAFALSSIP
jgi:hypothetical protein